jgi:hypothetical protein
MPDDLTNRVRARRIAELVGHPAVAEVPYDAWHLEYRSDLATFVWSWGGSDGRIHTHEFKTLATWHNVFEPGYISEEELNLLRVKVKLTTC